MIQLAVAALVSAGYDLGPIRVLIRAEMPPGYRGMTLDGGAALSAEAFFSQDMLNHVLEEELLHLADKAGASEFGPGTARRMEEKADEGRKFPLPPG